MCHWKEQSILLKTNSSISQHYLVIFDEFCKIFLVVFLFLLKNCDSLKYNSIFVVVRLLFSNFFSVLLIIIFFQP